MGAEIETSPTASATPNLFQSPNGTSTPLIPAPAQPGTGPKSWTRGPAPYPTKRNPAKRAKTPEPRLRQLMGVCGWAAVLGGVGLIIGVRGLIGVLADEPPTWYEPSMIAAGFVGIALTVGSFLTVQRRRLPWIMLSSSSVALVVAMSLTANAF